MVGMGFKACPGPVTCVVPIPFVMVLVLVLVPVRLLNEMVALAPLIKTGVLSDSRGP
jgi:hypothetical protein